MTPLSCFAVTAPGLEALTASELTELGLPVTDTEPGGVSFEAVNVLSDPAVRDGIKEYSSWPTIPQLYVKGEFVGGCDIIREMFESGELQDLLKNKGVETRAA